AILQEQLGSARVELGWLLRLPPGVSLARQFRHNGAFRPAVLLLLTYFLLQILSIAAWFVIGRGVFQGHFDLGWLVAWGLLLLATIPLQMLTSDAQGELSMAAGAIFRQRLLHGTLQLEPEEIRHQGMGQFLGRVMESEAVEMLALSGGFLAALSFIELGLAAVILANGAGQMFSVALLGIWVLLTIFLLWQYVKANLEWANAYRDMTNDLVERMVGHRTRLAQEDRRHWHDDEDQMLDRYLKLSQDVDEKAIWLSSLVTRGWMLVGLGSLTLPFVQGGASVPALAISLGGVLFAMQALAKLSGGVQSLAALLTAWQQVGPLFSASSRPRELQAMAVSPADADEIGAALAQNGAPGAGEAKAALPKNGGGPLVQARDLVFRYRPQGRPVLENCNLQIFAGDRILLEGPSGGGKSTLASLLTGLRKPEAGSLLLQGYDRQILGAEAWRERVVMAPQFQENHVFTETFAFNLLMGRRWPPRPEDLQEAEEICRELGLGDLLERMPSGFQQMLGESGWRLSHGERSRLYIARTLLQKADLIILDESFGALDPENLNRALRCVLNRAPTLLVIAHP
ncbi:MAG TPA: ABC transporter ATP-binding protein, partial [Anaerolineales bacterium]|nr:ABC transporter ATP-binding protein [Anaerolineales bacterium]